MRFFQLRSVHFSLLIGFVVLGLLASGCASTTPQARSGDYVAKRIEEPPENVMSLGALRVQFDLSQTGDEPQTVALPLSDIDRAFVQDATLQLAKWNPKTKAWVIVDRSYFDVSSRTLQAEVQGDGRYAVFGMSRIPGFAQFQGQLCNLQSMRPEIGGAGARIDLPRICTQILCPSFNLEAWGEALAGPNGTPIPGPLVDGYFGDICDQCVGGGFGVPDLPECHLPPDPVEPPELVQIPLSIPHGGRAVAIAVHPENDDSMVVASETGGLFRTTDRSQHWSHRSDDLTFDFTDVAFSSESPSRVVASAKRDTWVTSQGGLYWSSDSGATWQQAAANTPTADCRENWGAFGVDYEPEEDRFWAATSCGIAFSDDNGENWDYLPIAPGYTQNPSRAVISPEAGHLKILTGNRLRVTEDGGASWSSSTTGLPSVSRRAGAHNQIALSPFNHEHVFMALNFGAQNDDGDWEWKLGLYLSTDNGDSWTLVFDQWGINRPPFVRTTLSLSGEAGDYDLYFATGGCGLQRSSVAHSATPTIGSWTSLTVDHCDHADVAFENDGKTPLLLATDGGLHSTEDDGLTWTYTPDMGRGYNALQVTEVTGQVASSESGTDLYFGTQDNDVWGSPDGGATWPGRTCCEGFYLNVPRDKPASDDKVTGMRCGACRNFTSDPTITSTANFSNPPNNSGNPRLITAGTYIQNTRVPGVDSNIFNLSTDSGGSWTPRYGISEPLRALSEVAFADADPIVFVAVDSGSDTAEGADALAIKRIDNAVSGMPVVSDIDGLGSLGTFPTEFAWYKPYGVHPANPNFMLVPDIVADQVLVTQDGGLTPWTADTALTDLVTQSGDMHFNWGGQFVQVSTIGLDPDCDGHILVGTRQSGVLRSFDNGSTWTRVHGTTEIPRVSRFFFTGNESAIISSYGRGLWRLRYTCPGSATAPFFEWRRRFDFGVLYLEGRLIKLEKIDPRSCQDCRVVLAKGGKVLSYETDTQSGRLRRVELTSGSLVDTVSTRKIEADVTVSTGAKRNKDLSPELRQLLRAGNAIRGFLLDGETVIGLILASDKVADEALVLPKARRPLSPFIEVAGVGLTGRPVSTPGPIEIVVHGFDPEAPIRLFLDNEPIDTKGDRKLAEDGTFRIFINDLLYLGSHTITVEQQGPNGKLRDSTTFNVTVVDEENKGKRAN